MTSLTIGFIGLGHVGQALATKSVQAGNHVLLINRSGPGSLTGYVAELGPLAAAGTVAEAAQAEVVFLAVPWATIGQALQGLPNWQGRIVVDATNPILADGTFVDLGERTSSELVTAQMPSARVFKAFNSLFAAWMADEPKQPAGKLIADMGFAPIDLGGLWRAASSNRPASPWPPSTYY
jgi:predicted dinucleotide-binding enzyme